MLGERGCRAPMRDTLLAGWPHMGLVQPSHCSKPAHASNHENTSVTIFSSQPILIVAGGAAFVYYYRELLQE